MGPNRTKIEGGGTTQRLKNTRPRARTVAAKPPPTRWEAPEEDATAEDEEAAEKEVSVEAAAFSTLAPLDVPALDCEEADDCVELVEEEEPEPVISNSVDCAKIEFGLSTLSTKFTR